MVSEGVVGVRTPERWSFMAVPGCVTLRGSLDFSQPQISSLQKEVALKHPLRCLPALICNSNEHSEDD